MNDSKIFEDIVKKISETIPESVKEIHRDLEKNICAILKSNFSKLDLVSRDEMERQTKMIARTREKMEKLEKQVAILEEAILSSSKKKTSRDTKKEK